MMAKGISTEELDAMTDAELLEKLKESKEELFNLRFSAVTHRLEDTGRLKEVRRDIARIYTVKRERELNIRTAPTTELSDNSTGAPVRNHRKVQRGYVVSDKMDKTVVVEVEDRRKHPLYGKVVTHTKRVKAHDENNEVRVGDLVRIMETRPLSATKHFRVVEIIEKAK